MRAVTLLLLPLSTFGCAEGDEPAAIDEQVVYGILDTEVFLYDQNLIGLPVGAQDVTADCLLGGVVRIVGDTSGEGGTALDLTFSFDECQSSGSGYDLTLTGEVDWSGSFRSTGYKALASTSDSLTVVGTANGAEVDEDCPLAVTDRGEDGHVSVVSGEWCGRDVSF